MASFSKLWDRFVVVHSCVCRELWDFIYKFYPWDLISLKIKNYIFKMRKNKADYQNVGY